MSTGKGEKKAPAPRTRLVSSHPSPAGETFADIFGTDSQQGGQFRQYAEQVLDPASIQQGVQEKQAYRTPPKKFPRQPPAVAEELDLHGQTAAEAEKQTAAFLRRAFDLQLPAVLIITGKGRHSTGKPVLPAVVESTIRLCMKEQLVASYKWQGSHNHPGGAVIVYINGK